MKKMKDLSHSTTGTYMIQDAYPVQVLLLEFSNFKMLCFFTRFTLIYALFVLFHSSFFSLHLFYFLFLFYVLLTSYNW